MSDEVGPRVRLTVLGGFLGAGKSTWLRHQIRVGVFAGAVVLVNEAAATPVDDALLGGARRLVTLAGGCACCDGRPALIAALRALRDDWPTGTAEDGSIARIVLETSGLADPGPIVAAIRDDPGFAAWLEVSEVVVLVDAVHGLSLLRDEALARRQVAGANCLIMTKLDEAGEAEAAQLVSALDLLNPTAPVFGADRGVEVPVPSGRDAPADLPFDLPDERDGAPIVAAEVRLGAIDWTVFSLWLSALLQARGGDIFRVKGVVGTPAGRLLVQAVRQTVRPPEILSGPAAPGDGTIVVIGRGYDPADLHPSLRGFAAACGRG